MEVRGCNPTAISAKTLTALITILARITIKSAHVRGTWARMMRQDDERGPGDLRQGEEEE